MSDDSARIYYETREVCHRDVYKHLDRLRKSLMELKLVSKRSLLDNTLHWQKEIEKVKMEKDQEWQERMSVVEAENKLLREAIEKLSDKSKGTAENQVDYLNQQLDRKVIHVNKLQLALAEQSKAMFELEKSYVLLYRQYMKVRRME